jgi:ATP-dependent Clp protease ATP-binding subunit ClpX
MTDGVHRCSFCRQVQSTEVPLIAGLDSHICESCVRLAAQVVESWGRRRSVAEPLKAPPVPHEIKRRLDEYVIGQDPAKLTLAVAVYNHYKRLHAETAGLGEPMMADRVEVEKSNILLLGASGTGKTLLAGTLARIVGVPFAVADATTLTQAGYVGEDVDSIVARLLDAADGNRELAEWGIVYIDEIDKLARAGESAQATRDVSGEGVQQALLKLVEGTAVKIGDRNRKPQDSDLVDTRNILFIVGGAFAGLERILERRLRPAPGGIGFHSVPNPVGDGGPAADLFDRTRPEDLRHFGLIPEFIGRFPVITALQDLDEDTLVRILTEPKNALVRQYQQLFSYEGVALEFDHEALRAIAREAQHRGTGARGLRSVMEGLLKQTMYDLPSRAGVQACRVSEAAVRGEAPVEFVYGSGDADDGDRSKAVG